MGSRAQELTVIQKTTAPLDTYLFDLDGTIIDSIELILRSYRHTLQKHRGSAPPDSAWLQGLGTPLRRQLKDFCRDEEELGAMLETYRAYNRRHHD
ncbi:MAG: HAD hydrolase-like protein, partial [Acidobacteriota bacterium]